jgi:hypothetical protein
LDKAPSAKKQPYRNATASAALADIEDVINQKFYRYAAGQTPKKHEQKYLMPIAPRLGIATHRHSSLKQVNFDREPKE